MLQLVYSFDVFLVNIFVDKRNLLDIRQGGISSDLSPTSILVIRYFNLQCVGVNLGFERFLPLISS